MCNSLYLAFLGVLLHLWPGTARASSTVTGFEGIPYVWDATSAKDAATYPGANGREKIQAAIDDRTGEEAVTVLVPAAGPDANGVWALDQALILPSNTTLLLDGSKLLLNTGANDNMIRNANPFAGGTTNTKIAGRNGVHLDGHAGGQRRGFWGERNDNSSLHLDFWSSAVMWRGTRCDRIWSDGRKIGVSVRGGGFFPIPYSHSLPEHPRVKVKRAPGL